MLPFQAEDFLLVRELGHRQDAADRAVSLLARACPGASADALMRLTLGRRNAQLLDLRERLFGRGLEAFAECPHCGQALEFAVEIDALRAPFANDPAGAELELEADGYRVRFRLLDSGDLKAAAACADVAAARALLIERCVLEAQRDGAVVAAADLPETVLERTAKRIEAADPQAETLIDLVCPGCTREWQLAFDIASFLYAEVDAHARRILREVHALARGYGWSEKDILAMSARRRHAYLEMLLQ